MADSNRPGQGGSGAGEVDALRSRYLRHRDALSRLAADAPTTVLADSYNRLRKEVESSLQKLDQLDASAPSAVTIIQEQPQPGAPVTPPPHPARSGAEPGYQSPFDATYEPLPQTDHDDGRGSSGLRALLIGVIGVLAVALVAYFIWRYTRGTPDMTMVEELPSETVVETAAPPPMPEPPAAAITIRPESFDYGAVQKGTRKVQDFVIENNTGEPVNIRVGRSECRCLWFQHPAMIPAEGRATLSVTLDGGRAKAGRVEETVRILPREGNEPLETITVTADVR